MDAHERFANFIQAFSIETARDRAKAVQDAMRPQYLEDPQHAFRAHWPQPPQNHSPRED